MGWRALGPPGSGPSTNHRRPRLVPNDSYSVFPLPCLSEIVGGLPAQPELRVGPPRLFQANRHLRRDGRVAIQNAREGVTGDIEYPGRLGHVQAETAPGNSP